MNIIGYFHICQKDGWQKSFDIIFSAIKKSGLYKVTKEIRIGIVNDQKNVIPDIRLKHSKFHIIFCKPTFEYERPTLHHMRESADNEDTLYWYCHTKGIKHFGTEFEENVVDWIKLLVYWNIIQWKLAINMLDKYDTYGCNKMYDPVYSKNIHYSGNFWWSKSKHIKYLPKIIDTYYCAPEDWVCTKNNKMICIFSSNFGSGQHYGSRYNELNYILPENFNIYAYKFCNKDLQNLSYPELIVHFLIHGKNENRVYYMPNGFDFIFYKNSYDDTYNLSDKNLVKHWFLKGSIKNLKYTNKLNIIGYFHICQKDGWQKSFDIIFSYIKNSGLYNITNEIRIGIVNDIGLVQDDSRLNDNKFKIICCNPSSDYERPTLYHMRNSSIMDGDNAAYWYCHTKGLRHFNTENEQKIIDWIQLLSYWNFTQWKLAIRFLKNYDIYGCNAIGTRVHYSGNFWWAKAKHIQHLPEIIGDYYTGPEDWVCIKNDKMFNIFSCNVNPYNENFPKSKYEIPDDFDMDTYRNFHKDLTNLSYEELIPHYMYHGKKEGRRYK